MFYGHLAVGLAAKPLARKVSPGALLLPAGALDALCGVCPISPLASVSRCFRST